MPCPIWREPRDDPWPGRSRSGQPQREALAVVAYAQPVSRARIDEIRGSNSDAAVSVLLQRGLIADQRPRPDAQSVLVTTAECLAYLGLASLDELPRLQALSEVVLTDGPPEDN